MELVLKRPVGKPPCICIKFGSNYEASRLHCVLPNEHHSSQFFVRFVLGRNERLDMVVLEDGYKIPYRYENLKYSAEKLKRFLHETEGITAFNLCHIITVKNKDEVVYTQYKRKMWVIKLAAVELEQTS
ncbi:MAG: hypothetical protein WAQ28_11605 [Bacteroidia bacterium]